MRLRAVDGALSVLPPTGAVPFLQPVSWRADARPVPLEFSPIRTPLSPRCGADPAQERGLSRVRCELRACREPPLSTSPLAFVPLSTGPRRHLSSRIAPPE